MENISIAVDEIFESMDVPVLTTTIDCYRVGKKKSREGTTGQTGVSEPRGC